MQFKIKNTLYEISFSFFALILLFLTVSDTLSYYFVFLFALLHELIHLLFIYKFSVAPKKVSFTLFGANIIRDVRGHNGIKSEVLINLSAPVFNILSGSLFLIISVNVTNNLFEQISVINFALGLFNLIPFYNFDGGNALQCILSIILSERTTDVIITIISIIIAVIFSFVAVYIFINHKHNFSLVLISIYMIFSIIFKK